MSVHDLRVEEPALTSASAVSTVGHAVGLAGSDPASAGQSVDDALVAPPRWEKQVLELAPTWPELGPGQAEYQWGAERLRVFILTWDPFEWRPDRPVAFATSTSRPDGVGLVLYLTLWQLMARAGGDAATVPAVLGPLMESVMAVGGEQRAAIVEGAYAAGAHSGALPRLLSRVPLSPTLPPPTLPPPALAVVGEGWHPIQFDVLEDLGQDVFGPADLDRSSVRFREPGEKRENCPGCAGRAVLFPDGLKDTQDVICAIHRAEALRITTARLEAAKASNPVGWEALLEAGQRLVEPNLPNGLGPRLVAAASVPSPTPADLADHAALVIEAASLMEGLPDPDTSLGGRLTVVRSWLERLPAAIAAAGLTAEVAPVEAATEELLTGSTRAAVRAAMARAAAEASGESAASAAAAAAAQAVPEKPQPFRREARVGRNAACPCGSGKKYKFCHGH